MKVTIFRDYPEEGFPSIEVYTNNLISGLKKQRLKFKIKPYLALAAWSKKLGYSSLKTRLIFRFVIYSLLAPFHQGDINHVVDHTYGHLVYFLNPRKTVVTVHDLDVLRLKFLKWPTFRDKVIRRLYLFSASGLKRAAMIIAVSEDTKNDLIRFLKIPAERIAVIPEGVEPVFKKIDNKEELKRVKSKYHLPDKYLLHVGECWQYKNIEGILGVFKNLNEKKEFENLSFVKVGGTWTEEQKKLIRRLKIKDKVIKLPFVPRKDLPAIYNLAKILIQLSHLEGFGLTVLEAMACGCPVVVSHTPALKSLVAKAGIVVNPKEVGGVTTAVSKLLRQETKHCRYSRLGLKRAKLFNWQKTAEETIKVYRGII